MGYWTSFDRPDYLALKRLTERLPATHKEVLSVALRIACKVYNVDPDAFIDELNRYRTTAPKDVDPLLPGIPKSLHKGPAKYRKPFVIAKPAPPPVSDMFSRDD